MNNQIYKEINNETKLELLENVSDLLINVDIAYEHNSISDLTYKALINHINKVGVMIRSINKNISNKLKEEILNTLNDLSNVLVYLYADLNNLSYIQYHHMDSLINDIIDKVFKK